MLTYHVSALVFIQTYTFYEFSLKDREPDWFNNKRNDIVQYTALFLAAACFVAAHWQFAYEYFRLSYKTKLRNENMPVETNSSLLDAINYTVIAIIILLSAAHSVTAFFQYYTLYYILTGTMGLLFVLALFIMCYGLWLLIKIAKLNSTKANSGTVSIHIVAYVLVVLPVFFGYHNIGSTKAYETAFISVLMT